MDFMSRFRRLKASQLADAVFAAAERCGRLNSREAYLIDGRDVVIESVWNAADYGDFELTSADFSVGADVVTDGCEGTYIHLCLNGKFSESQEKPERRYIGHVKTLAEGKNACECLGLIAGNFVYSGNHIVSGMYSRLEPYGELEADMKRLAEVPDRDRHYIYVTDNVITRENGVIIIASPDPGKVERWWERSIFAGSQHCEITERTFETGNLPLLDFHFFS